MIAAGNKAINAKIFLSFYTRNRNLKTLDVWFSGITNSLVGISDPLDFYFLQSMWAMAPFRYVRVTQVLKTLDVWFSGMKNSVVGISDLLDLYFLQSMWVIAPFRYMRVTQELENMGHMVFRHDQFVSGDLGPIGLVLSAVHDGLDRSGTQGKPRYVESIH